VTARRIQAALLLAGGGSCCVAMVSYFAPGMNGVGSALLFLSPLLFAIAGPYALHWFVVRAPLVAVPSAAAMAVWGLSAAYDVLGTTAPHVPPLEWFFLVVGEAFAVAVFAVVGLVVGGIGAAVGGRPRPPTATSTTTPLPTTSRTPGTPRTQAALAGALAVLLVTGAFVAGTKVTRESNDPRGSPPPAATPPTGDAAPAPGVAPPATLDADARSVAFHGDVLGLTTVHLSGDLEVSAPGTVTDAAGHALGDGLLQGHGGELVVAAADADGGGRAAFDLILEADMVVGHDGVRIPDELDSRQLASLVSKAPVRVTMPIMTFVSRSGRQQDVGSPVTITPSTEPLDHGITIRRDGATDWDDPPATMALSSEHSGRTTLSWAGGGVVTLTPGGREYRDDHLGIKTAGDLDVTMERRASTVHLHGGARLAQLYRGGVPQLLARAGVRVKSSGVHARSGHSGQFTWAPENVGDTDMVMSRITPGNDDARWVSLGLAAMPELCGGDGDDACPTYGGDTQGFHKGSPINSVVLPLTGDERDIRFVVPADAPAGRHTLVLVVEGNFDPVRVEVPVDVQAA
jgi:hypothetical protein